MTMAGPYFFDPYLNTCHREERPLPALEPPTLRPLASDDEEA